MYYTYYRLISSKKFETHPIGEGHNHREGCSSCTWVAASHFQKMCRSRSQRLHGRVDYRGRRPCCFARPKTRLCFVASNNKKERNKWISFYAYSWSIHINIYTAKRRDYYQIVEEASQLRVWCMPCLPSFFQDLRDMKVWLSFIEQGLR